MSGPLNVDEMERMFHDLVKKVDDLVRDAEGRITRVEEGLKNNTQNTNAGIGRLEKALERLHDDLFSDKGLSSRVRESEQKLEHHSVWVKLVSAVVVAVLLVTVQHLVSGGKDEGKTAAASVGGH